MGVYGNISNSARSQLYFDKIYNTRRDMDAAAATDEVFLGRYVLIEYDEDRTKDTNLAVAKVEHRWAGDTYYYAYTSMTDSSSKTRVRYENATSTAMAVTEGDRVYTTDTSLKDHFYTCVGKEGNNALFEEIEISAADKTTNGTYFGNYRIDLNTYHDKRGYDSTVWRKVYEGDTPTYKLVATLNTVIPTLGLTEDAPTVNPIGPHWGTDDSNIYYNLHMQPNWGLRVKHSQADEVGSNGIDYPSDEKVDETSVVYNPTDESIVSEKNTFDGAIYFNKDGFDVEESNHSEVENHVFVTPTGKSGKVYNLHGEEDTNCEDIYEMGIILPALGNAVADTYDLLYGVNEDTQKRYRDTQWKDVLAEDRDTGDSKLGGATRDTSTLAGCINSVHDLMGMIIHETDEDLTATGAITDADMDKIYCKDGKYYRKHETYDYEEIEYSYEPIELNKETYSPSCYYYLVEGEGYFPATDSDFDENKSYFVKEFKGSFNPVDLLDYEPGTQYYKDSNDNYILDLQSTATNERFYCTFTATPITVEPYNGNQYFIKKYAEDGTFTGYVRNRGNYDANLEYFIIDDSNTTTTKFYLGSVYSFINESGEAKKDVSDTITPDRVYYSLITPPTGQEWDSEGNYYDVFEVVESSLIDLIGFEENKYYIKDNDDSYTLYTLADFNTYSPDNDITFYILTATKFEGIFFERKTFWYLAENGSYYLDNNEALDEEAERNYFTISNVEEITTPFFVPGAYYYYNEYGELVVEDGSSQSSDKNYFDKVNYYVIKDDLNNFAYGSVWSELVNLIPASVSIGSRTSRYEMLELEGFADSLNTIHGLILLLNTLLDANDTLTRDTSTLLGSINSLNDLLDKFALMSPGKFLVTDMYNRVNSVKPNTDTWLLLDINPYANNPKVLLSHKPANTDNLTSTQEGDEEPKFGETFLIPEVKYDLNGHIAEKATHTVKVPKPSLTDAKSNKADVITQIELIDGTGAFTTTRTNIGALLLTDYTKSTKDEAIAATDSLNVGLGKVEGKLDRAIEERNRLLDALDYTDEKANVTLFISKVTQEDGLIAVERADAGTLLITGYKEAETASKLSVEDSLNTALGKLEKLIDTEIDDRKTAIDNLDYEDDLANTSQFISKVILVDGKIEVSRSDAGTLLLTGYKEAETAEDVADTDSINSAFGKVQKQLSVLNAGSTDVGSVAYQIALIVDENDNESIDTLKEIANWIVSDTTGAAKMANDISTNAGDIDTLEGRMDSAEDDIGDLLENLQTVETTLENSKGEFESVPARFASAEGRIDDLEKLVGKDSVDDQINSALENYLDSKTTYSFDSYSEQELIAIILDMAKRITDLENQLNPTPPETDGDGEQGETEGSESEGNENKEETGSEDNENSNSETEENNGEEEKKDSDSESTDE